MLNLGVEGMMLIGAVAGFAVAVRTGSTDARPRGGGAGGGSRPSLIFAVLTLTLTANQVATGLALTIFGTGASSLIGRRLRRPHDRRRSGRSFPPRWRAHPLAAGRSSATTRSSISRSR